MATSWTKSGIRGGQASQSTTETAPTGTIGADLEGAEAVAVAFHAPAGQTFTGTGTMLGYRLLFDAWLRAPRSDVDMADYAGLSDAAPPSIRVDSPAGRFLYVPSGVGLSGGAAIVTDYVCTLRTGAQA